jgi:pyridoxine/pyridoxamine 5'-phosphate oxidase
VIGVRAELWAVTVGLESGLACVRATDVGSTKGERLQLAADIDTIFPWKKLLDARGELQHRS